MKHSTGLWDICIYSDDSEYMYESICKCIYDMEYEVHNNQNTCVYREGYTHKYLPLVMLGVRRRSVIGHIMFQPSRSWNGLRRLCMLQTSWLLNISWPGILMRKMNPTFRGSVIKPRVGLALKLLSHDSRHGESRKYQKTVNKNYETKKFDFFGFKWFSEF